MCRSERSWFTGRVLTGSLRTFEEESVQRRRWSDEETLGLVAGLMSLSSHSLTHLTRKSHKMNQRNGANLSVDSTNPHLVPSQQPAGRSGLRKEPGGSTPAECGVRLSVSVTANGPSAGPCLQKQKLYLKRHIYRKLSERDLCYVSP